MKDKVENIPSDFRGSLRPHSVYGSSNSSTSSYASSLSSASSSGSASESLKSNSSSFLHSKSSQVVNGSESSYNQYPSPYHTLRNYPSGTNNPNTTQLSAASHSSASSTASSTFDGYATIPAKFATLSVNQSHFRHDPRTEYCSPTVVMNPAANNFRHSAVIKPTGPNAHYGDPVSNRLGSTHNINRVSSNNLSPQDLGMRGVSSLGEVTSTGSHRSQHYASTPHLFVFQTLDDDDSEDDAVSQITKTNTLNNLRNNTNIDRFTNQPNSSRTLPRQLSNQSQKEPIYSSTIDIRKVPDHSETANPQSNGSHYEAPCKLSASRRASSCSMIAQDSFAVTNQVVARIETFFRGHKTQIWVCRTMANLYSEDRSGKEPTWNLKFTGVPLLLLDLGDTKNRLKRRLQIVVAEKESGFELWRDTVDNLTSYTAQEPHFHTLFLSSDHRRKIGLSFNEGKAAMAFHRQLEQLTSNPENISLSVPGKKKTKKKEKVVKYKAPRKDDISKPCNFHHVTTVDPSDKFRLYSMQVYSKNPSELAPEPITVINRPPPAAEPEARPAPATAV